MKLRTMISSMVRSAKKACRSCSPATCSKCRLSFARRFVIGCSRSPSLLEVARRRVDREPVDLEVGLELPQLARDRQVALHVAEADRARDEQRAALAAHRAHPGRACAGGRRRSRAPRG